MDHAGTARAIVALAAAGHAVPHALLEALAAPVLDAPWVRLALAVREGGPFALERALELAEGVLAAAREAGRLGGTGR